MTMLTPYVTHATFEDGLLKPDQALDLPPHARVRLTIEQIQPDRTSRIAASEAFERLCRENSMSFGEPRLTRDQLHDRG
jgi:predicted DNA-binding antitoxin AbrB/MazE fold protein